MLIDTHCHLNLLKAPIDPADEVSAALEAGVQRLIVVGIDAKSSKLAVELADRFSEVYATIGWHPTSTANFTEKWLEPLEPLVTHPKVVAVGEIGFDFHWPDSPPADQERALRAQLEFAKAHRKPVVYHSREAYPTLLTLLEANPHPYPQVLHCFAGDESDAKRAIDLDLYFGVDGPVTYPKAQDLRDLLPKLSRDRIVIETDSPWLTPAPYRGKPNRPAYLPYVAEGVAKALGISASTVAEQTTSNAVRLFSLPA